MVNLQEWIHKFEEGAGIRWLRKVLTILALLVFIGACNWRIHKNFSSQEAMDQAQLARNIAEGQGYTTSFIRPFSISLIKRVNEKKLAATPEAIPDYARLKTGHPDVSNPPVYPVVLAGWLKIGSWGGLQEPTDFFVSVLSQLCFFAVLVLTFFWARRLFDIRVAWISSMLLLASVLLWQFSFSGLSTMFLLLIFTGLIWCLTVLEQQMREPTWPMYRVFLLAAAIGLLIGVGGLTRYAFLWVIIPVLIFISIFGGSRRMALVLMVFFIFVAVTTPWIIRNIHLTGLPLGTRSYTIFESTVFPEYRLQRSLHPDMTIGRPIPLLGYKLFSNIREILQKDLPTLGVSWVTALFLTGLLIGFLNPAIRRVRYFLLLTLGTLLAAQALGRTQLSEDCEVLNSENLLVLLVPLVTVYGTSLFFVLLDRMTLPIQELRYLVIAVFGILACLPMIFTFLPPKPNPYSYPPYNPPLIKIFSDWMKPNELVMSDLPWAVAWYGHRQSIWLTLDSQTEFFEVNDFQKPVNAIYFSPKTMDARFVSDWVAGGEKGWGFFLLNTVVINKEPDYFPLRQMPPKEMGFVPMNIFLTDWARWQQSEINTNNAPLK